MRQQCVPPSPHTFEHTHFAWGERSGRVSIRIFGGHTRPAQARRRESEDLLGRLAGYDGHTRRSLSRSRLGAAGTHGEHVLHDNAVARDGEAVRPLAATDCEGRGQKGVGGQTPVHPLRRPSSRNRWVITDGRRYNHGERPAPPRSWLRPAHTAAGYGTRARERAPAIVMSPRSRSTRATSTVRVVAR